MKVTVVICTHNREKSLYRTLNSLCTQTIPSSDFTVLVVDNASTDNTKKITDLFTQLSIVYIYEPQLGLAIARNAGWHKASTDYVAFLDDDATAAPNWLEQILQTFDSQTTNDVVVGGQVTLALPSAKPAWLTDSLLFCLGRLSVSPGIHSLKNTSLYLPGCNIAFKKSTLLKHDGFQTLLGRTGNRLLSGEEILLQKIVVSTGGDILYNHQALVTHHINTDRLIKKWFMKRMYWEGVSNKKIEKILHYDNSVLREILALLRQVASLHFIFQKSFFDRCIASKRIGSIREALWSH